MNEVLEFLDIPVPDDRFVTPESLAWDLVMGDEMADFTGVMQSLVDDSNGNYRANRYEKAADEFQILITIYMEMIFNVLKSNFMGELLDANGDIREGIDLESELERYKPDFRKYNIDDMTVLFRSLFAKIRYFLSVRDITDVCSPDPNDFGSESNYYCKILLLDDRRNFSKEYFKNATHIPDDKRYTFMLKAVDKPHQKKLEEFYAVVYLPPYNDDSTKKPRKIRIAFEKYNVISANPHTAE